MESRKAMKVTAAATGWTARPWVQLEPMMTFAVFVSFEIEILYPCPDA